MLKLLSASPRRTLRFIFLLLLVSSLSGCTSEKKKLIYESPFSQRYPGQTLQTEKGFLDSTVVKLGPVKVLLYVEWDSFVESKFDCHKVGNIKIYQSTTTDASIGNINLTPLPCAVDWFTEDTVLCEKILISGNLEVKENGRKHTFEGNFCSIDGKGRIDNLLD